MEAEAYILVYMIRNKKQMVDQLFKKSLWITKTNKKDIESEAKKNWDNNQSALMRHIINNWFKR